MYLLPLSHGLVTAFYVKVPFSTGSISMFYVVVISSCRYEAEREGASIDDEKNALPSPTENC